MDGLVKQYNSGLTSVMAKHAPLITKQVRLRNNTPWYNTDIREAKRIRRQAERKWRKSRLVVDLQLVREARMNVNKTVSLAKSAYYNNQFEEASDLKEKYKISNRLMHKHNVNAQPDQTSDTPLTELFADFFIKKIDDIHQTFQQNNTVEVEATATCYISDLKPLTQEEVQNIINHGNAKTCKLDPIPTTLLLDCIDIMIPTLTTIINKSITEHKFPTDLKTALVSPLIKKPSLEQNDLNNYRPVSNLPYLAKLIEKSAVLQIQKHINSNNLLPTEQSAYRKHHSTETALVKIMNDLR